MPSNYNLKPLSLGDVKTYPLASRPSKVTVKQFARPCEDYSAVRDFLSNLPDILAVQSLRQLAVQIRNARDANKPIIWGLGGHVIKTGLGPIIIDLIKRGFVTGIATNGSVLIHDTEIALVGSTSEDVDATLPEGVFGGAEETSQLLNSAAREGANEGIGLGEALGRALSAMNPPHSDASILCAAYTASIPFTAHLTIGGDITHFHSTADGASLGATSHTDFRLLAELVRLMNDGGVYLNVGSAVVLPEVFFEVRHARAQSRLSTFEHYYSKFGFHPVVQASDECRASTNGAKRRSRVFNNRAPRNHDSPSRCRAQLRRY